jgi:hypothetical protein
MKNKPKQTSICDSCKAICKSTTPRIKCSLYEKQTSECCPCGEPECDGAGGQKGKPTEQTLYASLEEAITNHFCHNRKWADVGYCIKDEDVERITELANELREFLRAKMPKDKPLPLDMNDYEVGYNQAIADVRRALGVE